MTVHKSPMEKSCDIHQPTVKYCAGASIVRIKPLFTFDSKYILVASGCAVKVFSISSGECSLTFENHKSPIVSLRPNPLNHLQILSCSEDGTIIRWDYLDGKALGHYTFGHKNRIVSFYAPHSSKLWFFSTIGSDESFCRVYSAELKGLKLSKKIKIMNPVLPTENAIAIGPKGCYVAGVFENSLLLYNMETQEQKRHKTRDESNILCVACHSTDHIVATGDASGRIIVWTGMFQSNHPTRSVYHWHSLSLPDLVFSPEGGHIYSAGGESVLVKWNLSSSGTKQTLPRLGLPICHLAVSTDNSYIATAHIDNAIHIINSHNTVVQVVQGLTQGHCQKLGCSERISTGMIYDQRMKAILMNGRPGHLQFYDIVDDKQLFQLDIVGQNLKCQEKEGVVINTDIEQVALSSTGLWLATVECYDDGETSLQIRLKFWHFDSVTQKFTLNTNVFLPHNKKINCLKFQPVIKGSSLLAITTSTDSRFKTWSLNDDDGKSTWICEQMGYYKDMPAGEACFSEDGSLLCIAFNHVATLWLPDTTTLKTSLHIPQTVDPLRHVLFGRKTCNHYLVGHTSSTLIVWDIITLSVLWRVQCNIDYCIDNTMSEIMAAFTTDRKLFLFRPSSPQPICVLKDISSVPIVSAVFVPQNNREEPCCWQQHSRLYMLNQNQELLTVASSEEETDNTEKVDIHSSVPMTPFALMQAEHSTTGVKLTKEKLHVTGDKETNQEILDYPCPTNVNTVALCKVVLSSLLRKSDSSRQTEDNTVTQEPRRPDSEMESDDDEKPFQSSRLTETISNEECKPERPYSPLADYSFLLNSTQNVE